MDNEKEYWDMIFAVVFIFFAIYTFSKDIVDEKTLPVILWNSNAFSAFVYSFIVVCIVLIVLFPYVNRLKKQGKIK